MDTLRRLAAYLVEHERVDGSTFDELFDGRRLVPNASEEWRAATARPRAWGEVVDLAAHRVRSIPVIAAAVVAPELPAPAVTEAPPPPVVPGLNVAALLATDATVSHASSARRRTQASGRGGSLRRSAVATRRLRFAAAGVLERAHTWLRATAPEGD
jgi:hypothetical protein